MPNPKALWIVTLPTDSSPDEQLTDLNNVLGSGSGAGGGGATSLMGSSKLGHATSIEFPEFKVSGRPQMSSDGGTIGRWMGMMLLLSIQPLSKYIATL